VKFVEWGDHNIDNIPRPMVAAGLSQNASEWELPEHQHFKCELIYTVRGILTCEVNDTLWAVRPQSAIWIPSKTLHKSKAFGDVEFHVLFIDPQALPNLPTKCCTISVSPLLRELMLRVSDSPMLYDQDGPEAHMLPVILDELSIAPRESAWLPLPTTPQLRRLVEGMLAAPGDNASLAERAARGAMSERTLSRKFQQELSMSIGQWRRQLHIVVALQRLAAGHSVQAVAFELGYENASSFVAMFKKALGKPPKRYLVEQEG
jgi:AraC-like DNA-binding protein/mannose-6-phosphate isomerase-like protein (cupin superfamily)